MIIGITGRIATGKTSLAKILEERGFYRIDADRVYHELLDSSADMQRELTERFGSYDRESILTALHKDKNALEDLNSITHKYVSSEIKELVGTCSEPDIVLDVPVPVEIGFIDLSEYIIVTTCSRNTQLKRITARDGITVEQAGLKIDMQKEEACYTGLGDAIIDTDFMTEEDLVKSAEGLLDFMPEK